ncbi:MAG: hypothetical protein EOO74_07915 [Myxococcales bacterium]|nr:MAG: hypothetical protein EOO74_07915 [Myxococcales bacterium]
MLTGLTFWEHIDLGSGTPGETGQFFVGYGADHAWQWERTGITYQATYSPPVIEPSGDMLALRSLVPGVDLGDGVPVVMGDVAAALVRLDATGAYKASRVIDRAQLVSVARLPGGHVVSVGTHYAGADLGGGPLPHRGLVILRSEL